MIHGAARRRFHCAPEDPRAGHSMLWERRLLVLSAGRGRTNGLARPAIHQGNEMREVVLYVEDHPVNVLLMQTVFELRPQLDLVIAVDGESAMAATLGRIPSLLLLDLRLPDCHGTELLERLRRVPGWADIPAIAVTAEAEFMPAGTTFCDVWHKPLRVPTLLSRLDRLIAPRAQPDEHAVQRRASLFTRTTFAS
jgi:CheY-like chemotaxis protein